MEHKVTLSLQIRNFKHKNNKEEYCMYSIYKSVNRLFMSFLLKNILIRKNKKVIKYGVFTLKIKM